MPGRLTVIRALRGAALLKVDLDVGVWWPAGHVIRALRGAALLKGATREGTASLDPR